MNSDDLRRILDEAERLLPDEGAAAVSDALESDARRYSRAFSELEEAKLK